MNKIIDKCYIILLLVLFLVGIGEAKAQQLEKTTRVIPPSPASSSLEKYTDYPVSIYTGVPEISIPIYEIKSGNIVLPISISYHASGIKLDQNSYPVGVGWTLNAGGVVSRTVKDRPDEWTPALKEAVIHPLNIQQSTAQTNLELLASTLDKEPDLFSYNFGMRDKPTGKFVFDLQNRPTPISLTNPLFLPKNNVKFDYYNISEGVISMRDTEGLRYVFGGIKNGSKAFESTIMPPSDMEASTTFISSWRCSEIVPADQNINDKITFNYQEGIDVHQTSYSAQVEVIDSISPVQSYDFTPNSHPSHTYPLYLHWPDANQFIFKSNLDHDLWQDKPSTTVYRVALTKQIVFNGGVVNFRYALGSNMLENITVIDGKGKVIKNVDFFHSNFSAALGEPQKTKLDSVVFKAEGSTEKLVYKLDYETGPLYTHGRLRPDFWGYVASSSTDIKPKIHTWHNIPVLSINLDITYATTTCMLCPKVIINGVNYFRNLTTIGDWDMGASENLGKSYMLKEISYPTGGSSAFEFEVNKYKDTANVLTPAGGFRIKKIRTLTDDGRKLVKSFIYGKNGDGAGIPIKIPSYDDFVVERLLNKTDNDRTDPSHIEELWGRKRTFYDSAIQDLNFSDGSSVWYTDVDELIEDEVTGTYLGKTNYVYELPILNQRDKYLYDYCDGCIKNTYISRVDGFNFPNLVRKTIYRSENSNFVPVQSIKSSYYPTSTSSVHYIPVIHYLYYIDYQGDWPPIGRWMATGSTTLTDLTYRLYADTTVTYFKNGNNVIDSISNWKYYSYNGNHQYPVIISSGLSSKLVQKKIFKYPLDYTSEITALDDFSQGVKNLIALNVVSKPLEEIIELWEDEVKIGVQQGEISRYLPNKPYLNKVYALENENLLSSFFPSNIDNGTFVKDAGYKEDLTYNYTPMGRISMIENLSGNKTSFLWGYGGAYPIAKIENASADEVCYLDVDGDGTILEGNISSPVSFMEIVDNTFGYALDLSHMVGFMEASVMLEGGRDYELVYWDKQSDIDILDTHTIVSEQVLGERDEWINRRIVFRVPSDQEWLFLNANVGYVRGLSVRPVKSQMSTYTYKPLVGITSVTDAKSMTVYYEYDGFGRLKCEKDQNGKVLKVYDYHYRGQ